MSKKIYSISDLNPYRKNDIVEDAWLGLGDISEFKFSRKNPLVQKTLEDVENPGLAELRLMRDPEYLFYAAKVLLNLELYPFQCLILQELWNRTFPMFIASRGGGKSFLLAVYSMLKMILIPNLKVVVCGAAFRQSRIIFDYQVNIFKNAPILRDICTKDSGEKVSTDRLVMRLNDSTSTAIPLGTGEKIRGLRGQVIINDEFNCLHSNTLCQTDIGLVRIKDFMNGRVNSLLNINNELEIPDKFIKTPEPVDVYKVTTKHGYTFKCSDRHHVMTIDGWKLAKDLTNTDQLVLSINDYFPEQYVKVDNQIVDENMGWLLGMLISKGTVDDKSVPWSILQSPKSVVKEFLRGIFGEHSEAYSSTNEELIETLQVILLKFGIISNKIKIKGKLNEDTVWIIQKLCVVKQKTFVPVKSVSKLPNKDILYDFNLPKTHSFVAGGFLQHNSIDPNIYEIVLSGFTASELDPISNAKKLAREDMRKKLHQGIIVKDTQKQQQLGNQSILSGTCGYDFQHFATYWKNYKAIIESKGDLNKLEAIFGDEGIPPGFDWRDYSVIRIPFELIPRGFLSEKTISRARATMGHSNYAREYGACFPVDSDGFFPRTLIESCVVNENTPISTPMYSNIMFDAKIQGDKNYRYVYGIDPAMVGDNFSIVILELREDHTRVVYCWTTNNEDFKKRRRSGQIKEQDYFSFCARKIRGLMTLFPTQDIAIDAQGGGLALCEALRDPDKMEPGEHKLWPVVLEDKKQDTDDEQGLHILHMCQFANANWTAEANHNTKKDLIDKVLLFPRFDGISLGLASDMDTRVAKKMGVKTIYDGLEDCIMEIEELKEELCTIVVTRVGSGVSGRERWDTPEIQLEGKKGRMRKDRYSALIMANSVARQTFRAREPVSYAVIGGFAQNIKPQDKGDLYSRGPEWFIEKMSPDLYDVQIRR